MNGSKRLTARGSTGGLIAGIALVAASCGSSSHTSTPAGSASSGASMAAYTVSAHQVGNAGTVLVNGQGRTLYLLNSEKGGKITCTDANGCTAVWPAVELPSGTVNAEAGSGINASLLGTVKSATGDLYVTYGGWPLYTFTGDSASGTASGIGITSFGGTWYAVGTDGNPVMGNSSASSTTTGGGSGGGGYGNGGGAGY